MAQYQDAIAIDVDDAMVNSIKQKLHAFTGELTAANQPFLFRVPDHVRESNKNNYEPWVGSKCLRALEEHKWKYLWDFISRNPHIGLKHRIHEMKALETWARHCYFESLDLSKDEFIEMMLLDGCFIIEFTIKFTYGGGNVLSKSTRACPVLRSDILIVGGFSATPDTGADSAQTPPALQTSKVRGTRTGPSGTLDRTSLRTGLRALPLLGRSILLPEMASGSHSVTSCMRPTPSP